MPNSMIVFEGKNILCPISTFAEYHDLGDWESKKKRNPPPHFFFLMSCLAFLKLTRWRQFQKDLANDAIMLAMIGKKPAIWSSWQACQHSHQMRGFMLPPVTRVLIRPGHSFPFGTWAPYQAIGARDQGSTLYFCGERTRLRGRD